jgi:hypothetical protein
MSELVFITHERPIGGFPSYQIARVDLTYAGLPGQVEQVWLGRLDDGGLSMACVPFCAYGVAFGDRVLLDIRESYVIAVTKKSGNRVFRVLIAPEVCDAQAEGIISELISTADGCGIAFERHGGRMAAFNVDLDSSVDLLHSLACGEMSGGKLYCEWGDMHAFKALGSGPG